MTDDSNTTPPARTDEEQAQLDAIFADGMALIENLWSQRGSDITLDGRPVDWDSLTPHFPVAALNAAVESVGGSIEMLGTDIGFWFHQPDSPGATMFSDDYPVIFELCVARSEHLSNCVAAYGDSIARMEQAYASTVSMEFDLALATLVDAKNHVEAAWPQPRDITPSNLRLRPKYPAFNYQRRNRT